MTPETLAMITPEFSGVYVQYQVKITVTFFQPVKFIAAVRDINQTA